MSRQTLISLGVLFLVFVSGIAMGLYFAGGATAHEVATKSKAPMSFDGFSSEEAKDRVEENTVMATRIRDLEKELADIKEKNEAVVADRLAYYEKYHDKIGIQPFDQGLKVTPEMAELLGLSDAQKQSVEQHLSQVKNELEKVEDADTTLTKQTDNSISYEITADKQGDALKDELKTYLTGDMGDEKAKVFMDGGSWPFHTELFGFLEDKRQIDISWKPQPGNTAGKIYTTTESSSTGTTSMSGSLQPEFQKYLPTASGQ